jgi:hypothetical protein
MSNANLNNQVSAIMSKDDKDKRVFAHTGVTAVYWALVPDAKDQEWKFIEVPGRQNTYFISNHKYGGSLACGAQTPNALYAVDTRPHDPANQSEYWELRPVTGQPGVYQIVNVATGAAIRSTKKDNPPYETMAATKFTTGSIDQCWQICPSCTWDIKVTGINYKKDALKGLVGSPDIIWTASVQNDSKATIRQHIEKTISRASTFEFSFSESLSASISAEFEAGVPLIGSSKVSVGLELGFTATQTWTKTETLTYGVNSDVEIPPDTSAHLLATIDWLDNAVVPFTMVLRIKAKDIDKKPLDNGQLEGLLRATGFNGKIINNTIPNQLIVSIDGTLSGAWGINSTLILTEPEPKTISASPSASPDGKKMYRTIGRSPVEGLF